MDRAGTLYVVNEDGGGDVNHPQLWVYAPSAAANLAPTAVSLKGAVTSVPENVSTTNPLKLADIFVADDGIGDDNLSVSGPDAASFQIVGTALFLKAGTALSAATQSSYHVTVNVDDPTVGATPDASTSYTLTITPGASGPITLAVTEVAPWSSGNSPLAADWFELTNFGTSPVSLTGWMMDDNSNSFAVSVPLNGVASIAPGESVIFIETTSSSDLAATAQSFINLWYGGTAPAGLQIGSYSGSGVGLSTGGDAVNIFDNGGTLWAAVSFGVSPSGPFPSFDNSAGLNNATISNLSVVGQFGAFAAAGDASEIGSPAVTIADNDAANLPPTAVTLQNTVTSISETTNMSSDVRVADISVTDDGQGTNNLSVSGPDAASFEIVGSSPFLKAGTSLSHASKPTLSVTVAVDDPTVGASPDATTSFTLTVTAAPPNHAGVNGTTIPLPVISTLSATGVNGAFVAPGDTNEIGSPGTGNIGKLIITEVAPWASSNSPYMADWFEVTNVGGAAVDMTGWKMDDNSNSFAAAVPIVGVGSVAPGQSVVLIEGTSATAQSFVSAWFNGSSPAGFVIGSYTGSGVGLSTSGDAVNLFNTAGTLVTGVQFGTATTGFTFDNTAGLATVTNLSVAGINGAFLSADGIETGSPGKTK